MITQIVHKKNAPIETKGIGKGGGKKAVTNAYIGVHNRHTRKFYIKQEKTCKSTIYNISQAQHQYSCATV